MPSAQTVSELQVVVSADTSKAESGLSSLSSKLGGVGNTMATAFGAAALGGVVALAGGLTMAVGAASGFEAQMSAVKAVSGASASEMEALSTLALDLGKNTSFSASEAAKGIEELVKAGIPISEVIGGAGAASLDLAAAGAISVGDAAEIAANAMNQFNLKGSDLGHVADLIAGAANASAIDVNDFKFSLAAVGAVANTVGFSFDDTAAAIALLGQAGIKGSDAGTSLKTMFMSLQPQTDKQTALFRELGLITADGANAFFDASGKVKSMSDVAGTLQTALAGMTQQQKLATLETIFGSDAIRAAAVFANEGSEGFNEMAEAMGKVTAAQVAAERLNNLKGAFEQLKGSLETAAIVLGTALLPLLTQLVQWATEGINTAIPYMETFGKWLAENLPAALNTAAAAISPLLATLPLIGAAFQSLLTIFSGGEWDQAMTDAWVTLVDIFGQEGAQVITQFVSVAIQAFEGFAASVTELFGQVVAWVQENWPLIQETVQTVLNAISVFWSNHGEVIIAIVRDAWTILTTTIGGALDTLLSAIRIAMQIINGDWAGAWESLVGLMERQTERMTTILGAVFDSWHVLIDSATGGMLTGIETWMSDTSAAISGGMDKISSAISDGWETAKSAVSSILPTIQTAIMTVWNQIPEDIRTDLVLIATHIATAGATWVTNLTTAGANMLTAISTALTEMVTVATTWATTTFIAPIIGLAVSTGAAMTTAGSSMLTAITNKLSEIVGAVQTWADSTFLAPLRGLVSTATGVAESIGTAIVQGIISGVRSMGDSLSGVLGSMVRGALNSAKSALGIESPSKVFALEVGKPIVQGVMQGLDSMSRPLDSALSSLVTTPSVGPSYAMAGSGGGGNTYITLDARGAQVYDGSQFEDMLVSALGQAHRGGRITKVAL